MKSIFFFVVVFVLGFGCAGPNPNPGERTADIALTNSNFDRALEKVGYNAEKGYPWAQLRLGRHALVWLRGSKRC